MWTKERLKSACTFTQSDQSSLSAWKNFAFLTIQNAQNAQSEDSDQTANVQANLNLHWVHMLEGTVSDIMVQRVFMGSEYDPSILVNNRNDIGSLSFLKINV